MFNLTEVRFDLEVKQKQDEDSFSLNKISDHITAL